MQWRFPDEAPRGDEPGFPMWALGQKTSIARNEREGDDMDKDKKEEKVLTMPAWAVVATIVAFLLLVAVVLYLAFSLKDPVETAASGEKDKGRAEEVAPTSDPTPDTVINTETFVSGDLIIAKGEEKCTLCSTPAPAQVVDQPKPPKKDPPKTKDKEETKQEVVRASFRGRDSLIAAMNPGSVSYPTVHLDHGKDALGDMISSLPNALAIYGIARSQEDRGNGGGGGNPTPTDGDGDGVPDTTDQCPTQPGPAPTGCPNVTPTDQDGDGIADTADNCPAIPNPGQADHDRDNIGDVCDPDDDNDTVVDTADQCPLVFGTQSNGCPPGSPVPPAPLDTDGDGITDAADNCPVMSNPGQGNHDRDGQGDACDPDDDNDTVVDVSDTCPLVFGTMPNGCPPPTP